MSWIVERLIIDSDKIRRSVENSEMDSDLFLDLLALETKINFLLEKNYISDSEKAVLLSIMSGHTISTTARKLHLSRSTVSLIFSNVCKRIAFYMGDYFTDDGYLDYMEQKYDLTKEQVEKAHNFIRGKYKHNYTRSNLK